VQKKAAAQLPAGSPDRLLTMPKIDAVEIPKKYSDPQDAGITYNVHSGSQVHDIKLE
jgi:hypothetical protein